MPVLLEKAAAHEHFIDITSPLLHAHADPACMQPYLAKCFAGLHQLHITEEAGHSPEIVAMVSLQGERVPFVKPLRVRNWSHV